MYIEMNPTGLTLSDLICVAHRKQSEYTCFANVKENVFHYRLRLAAERATMAKICFLDREHRARKRSIECVGTIKVSLHNFLSLPQPKVFGVHRKRQSEKSVLYRKRCSTLFVNMMQYEIGRCMPP